MEELNEALERLREHATYCTNFPKGDLNRVADQINALLAERDDLVDEIKSLRLIVVDGDAKIKSLTAIARKQEDFREASFRNGLPMTDEIHILDNNLTDVISAHEQKYGPIGGE